MKNKSSVLKLLSQIFLAVAIGLMLVGLILFFLLEEGMKLFGMVWFIVGAAFLVPTLVLYLIYKLGANKKESLIAAGNYVMAEIVDIDVNVYQKIQVGNMPIHPYFITCRYVDAMGNVYFFKSRNLLYNPSGLLKSNLLKVYVDLSKPKRYYVETDFILPGEAVLHKFNYDTDGNAKRLIEGGQYIQAVTCGVEHTGRIRVSGIVAPMFMSISESLAEKWNWGRDEKGRVSFAYSILCRYDAPDGTPHIFASQLLFGEPASDYMGQIVNVYYSGKNFKKHHVDLSGLGLE